MARYAEVVAGNLGNLLPTQQEAAEGAHAAGGE
jgi:hypothetical protein